MTRQPEHDLLGALEQRWDNYPRQLKIGRREITEASIHDLRVAARRFQASLDILGSLDPHPHAKKLRGLLRKQLDQLNALRDAQVMVQEAIQTAETRPELGPFGDYLQSNLEKLAAAARKDTLRSRPSGLKERIQRIRRLAKKHADDEQLLLHALRAVDSAHARARRAFRALAAEDPTTIHRLRIAFKKFRYMVETIQVLLPDYPPDLPGKMHDYQDAMGKVHDTTVLLSALKDFGQRLQRGGKASSFDIRPIELYYQKRLRDLIQAYFQRKDEFHTFWRGAPEQPFPWEKSHEPLHRTARDRRTTGQPQQRRTGQPAPANGHRPKEVPGGGTGAGPVGDSDRSDNDQSIPAGG